MKVIIGHKVKQGADLELILLKFRSKAMQYPGFVDSESLLGEKDASVVVTITTWERAEDWREWEHLKIRQQLYHEAT